MRESYSRNEDRPTAAAEISRMTTIEEEDAEVERTSEKHVRHIPPDAGAFRPVMPQLPGSMAAALPEADQATTLLRPD